MHKRIAAANNWTEHLFWLSRLQRDIASEPQIRDVCDHCNNVVLSQLDSYVCTLFDKSFVHIPERDEEVVFDYDYHSLKRWLLKVCFNSARIHQSRDLYALEPLAPYILGQNDALGRSVQLFVQLIAPEEIPEDQIPSNAPKERPLIYRPTISRVGHAFFRVAGIGEKLLRAVHIRSYQFTLAFFKENEAHLVKDDFAAVYMANSPDKMIRASEQSIKLTCNGMGAWAAIKGSRANRIDFKNP